MNYAEIKKFDIANGTGVRVSLFVSGCRHRCKGCFNEEAWDFSYGKPFLRETEDDILSSLKPDYISGLSLLGGEPFEKENQEALLPFLKRVREAYPLKDIWCYTGFTLEALLDGNARTAHTAEMFSLISVLVDGPFILEKKNVSLKFRGSENQRIIDLPLTLSKGEIILKEL